MRSALLAATAIVALMSSPAMSAEDEFTATLVGHAILPAATFIKPPADAPESLAMAAKYTTPDRHRADALGSVPGMDGVRPTGLSMPFDGQAVQGFSGIKMADDGTFWSLSDNGFGNKLNSVDAALMLHHLRIDWATGTVERIETVFLTDPDKKVWFPIVNEATMERYLTGADFDIESIQPVADGFWIGDELGPFFVKVDKAGKVVTVVDTVVDGKPVKSPDHPTVTLQANPTLPVPAFNLKRSGGYEGLAQSKDGARLYGLLEGALFLEDGTMEMADGNRVFRIVELDAATATLTGRTWLYRLADGGDAIGDFNMIDDTTALVIERDQGAGTADKACADPKAPTPDCFASPGQGQAHLQDRDERRERRRPGYEDRLHRSPEHQGSEQREEAGRRRRLLRHAVQHHRERRRRRRDAHHRCRRQQPALLGGSRARQGRRQRVRPARGRRVPQGRGSEPIAAGSAFRPPSCRGGRPRRAAFYSALTMPSVIFLASPRSIMVLSR